MRLLARNTFISFRRRKIFYIFFFSYVFLFVVGLFLGELALNEQQKVVIDFLFMAVELLGVILILFFATRLLSNEKKQKTQDLVLLKLKKKYHFFLAKFLGFALLLGLFFVLVAVLFSLFFLFKYGFGDTYVMILIALFFVFIKMLVLLAIVMLFSLFISPVSSLFVALIIYVLSHSLAFIKYYYSSVVLEGSVFIEYLMSFLYYILPNFSQLSLKEFIFVSNSTATTGFDVISLVSLLGINLAYIFVLLFLAIIIYSKRVNKVN